MRNTSKWLKKTMRRERTESDVLISKFGAFNKNKNVMITIPNPAGKSESDKPFIRVNAKKFGLHTEDETSKQKWWRARTSIPV